MVMAVKYYPSVTTGQQGEYRRLAIQKAKKYNLDPAVFVAQIQAESNFINTHPPSRDPYNDKYVGALGLAQFMPETGWAWGLKSDADRLNPDKALDASARHMADNLKRYGTYERALSVYNSGEPHRYKDPDYSGGQTYDYVKKIMAGAEIEAKRISPQDLKLPTKTSNSQTKLIRDTARNGYQTTNAVYRPDTTTRSTGPTIRVRTVSDDNPINVEPDWSIGSTDTSSQAGFTSPDTGTNNFSDPGTDYLNMVAQTLGLTNLGIPGFGGGQNTNAFVQPSFGNSITTNNIWGTPQYNVYNPYGQYNQAYNPPSYTNFNQGNNFTQPSPTNDGIRSIVASVIRSVVGRILNPKGQSDWNSRPQGNGNNFLNQLLGGVFQGVASAIQ
jgi:hypothetical protein